MRIDVLTIFPEMFDPFLRHGMVERARRGGALEVHCTDLRDFTNDRHRTVDDRTYGGGPGMLLKPEPVFRALDILAGRTFGGGEEAPVPVLLCPTGDVLRQRHLAELARERWLLLLCGRYEGFDARIGEARPWRRISVGEYVLSGGEVPAMLLIEGVARLLPGVLGHPESNRRDSFSGSGGASGFDHPHYTRPPEYRGKTVPEVLLSGNHEEIEVWRRRAAECAAECAAESTSRNPRSAGNDASARR